MTRHPAQISSPLAVLVRSLGINPVVLGGLTLLVSGCSSEPSAVTLPSAPLHPVKGSVLKADGKPLTEGTVVFSPTKIDAKTASGALQPDGTYTLKTGTDGVGAAEGEYRVYVDSPATEPGAKPGTTKMVVPPNFTEESSTLKMVVKSGSNEMPPIKLLPAPAKKVGGGSRRGGDE